MQEQSDARLNIRLQNSHYEYVQKTEGTEHWWLTPVILATQEAAIRRIVVQSQHGLKVHETLSRKTLHKKELVE
jgi:hypothetical protein